jgi:hypothetical protein
MVVQLNPRRIDALVQKMQNVRDRVLSAAYEYEEFFVAGQIRLNGSGVAATNNSPWAPDVNWVSIKTESEQVARRINRAWAKETPVG